MKQPISVGALSGVTLTTNDGGKGGLLLFTGKGSLTFGNLSSTLVINGSEYGLVNSVGTLSEAIASDPAGSYALAADYDASGDGIYSTSPVATTFTGSFNGLGHTISHLSIDDTTFGDQVGLFAYVDTGGTVASIKLSHANVQANEVSSAGTLVGLNLGLIENSTVAGSLNTSNETDGAGRGGLNGINYGQVLLSGSSVVVLGGTDNIVGGLVGVNEQGGSIAESYASGDATALTASFAGGLAGSNAGTLTRSYAMGSVSGGTRTLVGGVVGINAAKITQSYSTTALKHLRHVHPLAGGLIGVDHGRVSSSYWDLSTSHVKGRKHGAGRPRRDPGIAGLTTEQFQSGLPNGFGPKVWAEDPNINNGMPYLLDNPPQE